MMELKRKVAVTYYTTLKASFDDISAPGFFDKVSDKLLIGDEIYFVYEVDDFIGSASLVVTSIQDGHVKTVEKAIDKQAA